MNILQIQNQLPWGIEYSEAFQQSPSPFKDFQHALLHVTKAGGKLAAIVEDADHGRPNLFPKQDVEKYLADLVICAMRMANTNPTGKIDLQRAVIDRLESKNGVTLR